MNMNKKLIAVTVLASIPVIALAVDIGTLTFKGLVAYIITDIIRPITVLILALAVVYFLWNIAEIIRAGKQGEELANLKTKAFWGVVAIFVMISLWGLVQILVNTFVPRAAGIPFMNTGDGESTGVLNVSDGRKGGFTVPTRDSSPCAQGGGDCNINTGAPQRSIYNNTSDGTEGLRLEFGL